MKEIGHYPPYLTKKLVRREDLAEWSRNIKELGKKVVTLNGSFDLLHAGHLTILYEASLQGDCLLLALNTDASIKRYKGERRPIIPLKYRLEMMAAIEWVDFVTWFDEDDPRDLLREVAPHVHVNGADWGENCIEADTVRQGGGRLHIVQLVPGLSTTKIIEKIHETYSYI